MIQNELIEGLFLDQVQLDTYVKGISEEFAKTTLPTYDVKTVSRWVRSYFAGKETTLEALIVQAFVLGQMFGESKHGKVIKELPSQSKLIITGNYEEALEYTKKSLQVNLANATDETNTTTRSIIFQELSAHHGWRAISDKLREGIKEGGDLQRYWGRVAITEVATAINNGFLSMRKIGDFVIGFGYDDACKPCKDLIIGKVYRVSKAPTKSFEDVKPGTKEYKDLVEFWDNNVWVGKNNYGRSRAETKSDGTPRLKHEQYAPCLPLHPNDRCRWGYFDPNLVYIDAKGNVIPRIIDENKWREFANQFENRFKIKL